MANKPFFYNDVDVFADDLNQIISYVKGVAGDIAIAALMSSGGFGNFSLQDTVGGVFGSPADYSLNINLKVLPTALPSTIVICRGKALDKDGNYINLSADVSLTKGNSGDTYSWEGSTGTNYIKLTYREASGSVKPDLTGALYPTRFTPSYFITIDNVPPSTTDIALASFVANSDGSVITGTITDIRQYLRTVTSASAVMLNPISKRGPSSHNTLEDHTNGVGTGVVSERNPHGLSLADLGSDTIISNFINHATQAHLNGIVVVNPALGGAYDSFKGTIVNSSTPNAAINFTAPTGSVLFVNSKVITSALNSIKGVDAGGTGNYYAVYYDSDSLVHWVASGSVNYSDIVLPFERTGHINPGYYILGKCVVSSSGTVITSWVDLRAFGTMVCSDISAESEGSSSAPSSANPLTNIHTLKDNLARMRYAIAMGIKGSPNWPIDSYPLTNGGNADAYHKHNLATLQDLTTYPTVTPANLGKLTNKSNADDLHYHSLSKSILSFIPDLAFAFGITPVSRNNREDDLGLSQIPTLATFGNNSLYLAVVASDKIAKVDPFITGGSPVYSPSLGMAAYYSLHYDGSYVYATGTNKIKRLNKDDLTLIDDLTLTGARCSVSDGSVLWNTNTSNTLLSKIVNMAVISTIDISINATKILNTGDYLWLTYKDSTVLKMYDKNATVTDVTIGGGTIKFLSNPVFDGTHIWVVVSDATPSFNCLAKINAATGFVLSYNDYKVPVGLGDFDLLFFDGINMWLASTLDTDVYVFNSTSGQGFVKSISGSGNTATSIAFDGSYVWFTRDAVIDLHKESALFLL